jgi:hypothetical protein
VEREDRHADALHEGLHRYVDGYAVDLYCSSFIKEHRTLDGLIALAGDLPVGVWEIGNTAENGFFPTKNQLDAYMDHIRTTLSRRAASGLPVGSIAWYQGPNPRTPLGNQNELVGDHPTGWPPRTSASTASCTTR